MDKRTIAQRLALAESQVEHVHAQINRQRTLIQGLERNRLVTFLACKRLKELEENLASFIEYRDRLASEMALSIAGPARVAEDQPSAAAIQKQTVSL